MKDLIWYCKQLLPLTYRCRYKSADGKSWFAVWRMWFGHVFSYECVEVA